MCLQGSQVSVLPDMDVRVAGGGLHARSKVFDLYQIVLWSQNISEQVYRVEPFPGRFSHFPVIEIETVHIDDGAVMRFCHFTLPQKAGASVEAPHPTAEAIGVVDSKLTQNALTRNRDGAPAAFNESRFPIL